jgi:very-short-patch-repair endonuclease
MMINLLIGVLENVNELYQNGDRAPTDSPIEREFVNAFMWVAGDRAVALGKEDGPDIGRRAYAQPGTVFIAPQVKFGPYRADFMVAAAIGPDGTRPTVLCVECDGREFHTNVQRDIDRDWWFEQKGIKTLRFSGGRILKDPYGCAYEVLAAIGAPSPRYTQRRKFGKPVAVQFDPDSDEADGVIE